MAVVAVVKAVTIVMHFNDHPPPHFHAVIAEHRAIIKIDTLDIVKGSLPPGKYKQVREWAQTRQAQLMQAWQDCRSRKTPGKIK